MFKIAKMKGVKFSYVLYDSRNEWNEKISPIFIISKWTCRSIYVEPQMMVKLPSTILSVWYKMFNLILGYLD